jgi:hypothetical protein
MNAKVDFFFKLGSRGWQEVYWRSGDPDLQTSLQAAEKLASWRAGLLGPAAKLTDVRVSDVSVNLDSLVSKKEFNGRKVFLNLYTENITTAVLCRLNSGSKYRRSLYMRGQPKSVQLPPPDGVGVAADWLDYFARMVKENFLGTTKWCLRVQPKAPDGAKRPVTSIQLSPGGNARLAFLTALPAFAVGSKVRLKGFLMADLGGLAINGDWEIQAREGTINTIRFPWDAAYTYSGGATAQDRTPVFEPVTSFLPQRIVRRKAGRVYGDPKGRITKKGS